jgi:hypothetical protein
MSEPVYVVPSIGDILANNFLLVWNVGTLLFTKMKNTKTLHEAFHAARKFCKSDQYLNLVDMGLNANEILLNRIIARNNSDYKATEELESLGDDIAKLIKFLNK